MSYITDQGTLPESSVHKKFFEMLACVAMLNADHFCFNMGHFHSVVLVFIMFMCSNKGHVTNGGYLSINDGTGHHDCIIS